jgi:hypothetical protein
MGPQKKAIIRVVLDTNVLVSALLFRGELSAIHSLWKKGRVTPLISRQTFSEIQRVLNYPKFKLSRKEIESILEEEILPFFDIVEPAPEIYRICRDPDDDKFLSCAVSGQAEYVVSGDKDLLILKKFYSVTIITPLDFLRLLK